MRKNIRYKHLWAWGVLMGRTQMQRQMDQDEAEQAEAPVDAIYYLKAESRWRRAIEIINPTRRELVAQMIKEL